MKSITYGYTALLSYRAQLGLSEVGVYNTVSAWPLYVVTKQLKFIQDYSIYGKLERVKTPDIIREKYGYTDRWIGRVPLTELENKNKKQ